MNMHVRRGQTIFEGATDLTQLQSWQFANETLIKRITECWEGDRGGGRGSTRRKEGRGSGVGGGWEGQKRGIKGRWRRRVEGRRRRQRRMKGWGKGVERSVIQKEKDVLYWSGVLGEGRQCQEGGVSGGEGMSCIEEECQRAVPGGKRKYQQDEVNVRKKVSVRRVSVRRKRLVVSRRTYCLTRELANVSYFFPFFSSRLLCPAFSVS